jgi:hypothetical protein
VAGTTYDFAIFGSTPFAAILAGSLARHGKRVLRVGSRASPQRLSRRFDLALPMATRPQTWSVLSEGAREIRALLLAMGAPDALIPVDVRLETDTDASAAFASHMSHLALAHGLKPSRKGPSTRWRNVTVLRSERAEDKIADWLAAAGVRSIDPHEVRMSFATSDTTSLIGPDGDISAGTVIAADDVAILELPADLRPPILRAEELTTTLVGKIRPLNAPVALFPDRGVSLMQRDDGSVLALVSRSDDIEARLASVFSGPFPIARLATGRTHHLVSIDGAPLVGALNHSGLSAAAGLGNAAIFFAPALARHLTGGASKMEADWFAAHDPARPREPVTEAVN